MVSKERSTMKEAINFHKIALPIFALVCILISLSGCSDKFEIQMETVFNVSRTSEGFCVPFEIKQYDRSHKKYCIKYMGEVNE